MFWNHDVEIIRAASFCYIAVAVSVTMKNQIKSLDWFIVII